MPSTASQRRWERRTVNPPIDPARYNFLYRARPAQAADSVATARSELSCSYRTRYLIARYIKLSIGFMNSINKISPRRCEVIVCRMLII